MGTVLPGRLAPAEMFPAGRAGYAVQYVTLPNGVRVRVVRCEPDVAAARDAPTAVFVHGWACSAYTWHRNLRAVADAGHRVVAFDLVGHGLSDKPLDRTHYTLPALAEFVRATLDALDIERAVLVGHSMGAAIAMRVATDTPARVAGLVLLAPVGFGSIGMMRLVLPFARWPFEAILPYVTPRWSFRVGLWRAYGRIGRPSARDVDEYWAPTRDPDFLRAIARLSRAFEWSDGRPAELVRIACPTMVLFGARDHLVRERACARYVECIPGVRWATIRNAGHTLPEEVPELVNATVLDAVRRAAIAHESAS